MHNNFEPIIKSVSLDGSSNIRAVSLKLPPGYLAVKLGELQFTISTDGNASLMMTGFSCPFAEFITSG